MMWTQLATAIVFGLGFATVLTLVVTPSLLALRVWWFAKLPQMGWRGLRTLALGAAGGKSRYIRDRRLTKKVSAGFRTGHTVRWDETYAFGPQRPARPVPPMPDISTIGSGIPEVAPRPVVEAPDPAFIQPDLTPTVIWTGGTPRPMRDDTDDEPPFPQAAE
jgi:multidrug efflux pump